MKITNDFMTTLPKNVSLTIGDMVSQLSYTLPIKSNMVDCIDSMPINEVDGDRLEYKRITFRHNGKAYLKIVMSFSNMRFTDRLFDTYRKVKAIAMIISRRAKIIIMDNEIDNINLNN